MSEESRTTLKSYFQTNDVPTQSQFENLIDSVPNNNDDYKLYRVDASLSSAEILAGVVKQIIAAPGSGKYINLVSAVITYKHGGVDYVGGYNIRLSSESDLSNIYFDSAGGGISEYTSSIQLIAIPTQEIPVMNNKALYLGLTGTPTTGNGTLKIDILYTIENY